MQGLQMALKSRNVWSQTKFPMTRPHKDRTSHASACFQNVAVNVNPLRTSMLEGALIL